MKRRELGFTAVELLVVLAIIGILSVLASASYRDYVLRATRVDGQIALLSVQLAQERHRTFNPTYTASLATLALPSTSEAGNYTIAITAATANSFTATATALGAQANDTACATLSLNPQGPVSGTESCWQP